MSAHEVHDGSRLDADLTLSADVVIVGSGAGGGYAAEVLATSGLRVVLVEAGGYHTAETFSQNESKAYPMLYQEAGAQRTKDKGVIVFQGRSVGGSTTVNWTTSFRTPDNTLAYWQDVHGVSGASAEQMAPHFEAVEKRLNIALWEDFEPNPNNAALKRGCEALGFHTGIIKRNVKYCGNTGLCGLGCPLDAKQSMLNTTIPGMLEAGGALVHNAEAARIEHDGARARAVLCRALDARGNPTGRNIRIEAGHVVVSCGSIRSPALMMRSDIPDPSGMLGKRTFLHPVSASMAIMDEITEPYYGAPQSAYSDQFLWPDDDRVGFKLETTPLQPVFAASVFDKTMGQASAAFMKDLPRMQSTLGLLRDGFHDGAAGGTVELTGERGQTVDYPITDYLREGLVRALETAIEVQFAAGATAVYPWHIATRRLESMDAARAWLTQADMGVMNLMVGSAHVMGGCIMGDDPARSVVNSEGAHHVIENLSVFDGSVFPTSIGANPQESIYAMTLKNAAALAAQLS